MSPHRSASMLVLVLTALGAPADARAELGLYCSVLPGRIECRMLPIPLPAHLRHHLPDAPLLFSPRPLSQAPRTIQIGEHRYALTAESSMRAQPAAAPSPTPVASPPAAPDPPAVPEPHPIDTQAEPRETALPRHRSIWRRAGGARFRIELVARYQIAATVLSRSAIQRDLLAPLVPVDLALGWGAVGKNLLDAEHLRLWHEGRTLQRRLNSASGLEPDYAWSHSSNNHVIPATHEVSQVIDQLVAGDRVELAGYLVNVWRFDRGRFTTWRSSRSRTDTGENACEIFYVTSVRRER